MVTPNGIPHVIRFGAFELDLCSSELRRNGMKVMVGDQPIQILQSLLERPGELVTREQLRQRLWKSDTYVDFDLGLNSAVRKLREALGDSAENPRFVQTLPRRGYRFIAPIVKADDDRQVNDTGSAARMSRPNAVRKWALGTAVLAVAAMTLAVVYARGRRDQPVDMRATNKAAHVDPSAESRGSHRPRHATDVRAVDPAAYSLYITGQQAVGRQTIAQFRDAIAYFEEALARQPDFAEAHAALAGAQLQ